MRMIRTLFAMTLTLGMSACAASLPADRSEGGGRGAISQLPATFAGQIPCADCPGIDYTLNLFPDQSYFLSMEYLERDQTYYDLGRWTMRGEGGLLVLDGYGEGPTFLRVVDQDRLRLLDADGEEIRSELNYTLTRAPRLVQIEPRLTLEGMYQYMADAALFTECRSGRRFPVSMEADNVALERGYLEVTPEPGAKVLVRLEARIAERPAMEGDAMTLSVVPERFISATPGEECPETTRGESQGMESEIEGGEWQLARLNGKEITTPIPERRPSLRLDRGEGNASGAAGCNLFSGNYQLEGQSLRFGPLASTKMYCEGAMEIEREYLDALEKTRGWRVEAGQLLLLDRNQRTIARLRRP